jgi:hypothetical protein
MAAALERGDLEGASEQGKQAVDALGRAERNGSSAAEGTSDREIGEQAGEAAQALRRLLRQAEDKLAAERDRASRAASTELEKAAGRERALAERARQIRRLSQAGEAPLPERMLRRLEQAAAEMLDAAKQLEAHRGPLGLERQREAQRLLELSQPEPETPTADRRDDGQGRDFAQNAAVPGEQRDASAAAFRKRVTEGLGRQAPAHLRESLRRYAEGLVQ